MKKIITAMFIGFIAIGLFASSATAEVNAVTPSTNDINRTNGWAHVNQLSIDVGETELEFVSTRNFYSCFEYRTDGDTTQKISDTNYNPDINDGLYPYHCVNNSSELDTIDAIEYVEVRMVFGAETDERFDWTRFDVLPSPFVRSAVITSPLVDEEVSGMVSFDATLTDEDGDDNVQWVVRKGTCDMVASANIIGNVTGVNTPFDWDGVNFHATADTSSWVPGDYCFVFNPTESAGDTAIRETREFIVADTKAPLVTIESPSEGDTVSGIVQIFGTIVEDLAMGNYNIAIYPGDADYLDFSQRLEQDNVNPATIFSNQEIYQWDTTGYEDGEYLIRFAARDAAGNRDLSGDPYIGGDDSQHVIKVVVDNVPDLIGPPTNMDQCKLDGWMTFNNPTFKNQGACVSYVQSNEKAGKRN